MLTTFSVAAAGYTRDGNAYTKSTLPPLEFGYSLPTRTPKTLPMWEDAIADVDVASIGKKSQWVDLDGEGLSGLLCERGGGWFYQRNEGQGHLGPLVALGERPSRSLGSAQLMPTFRTPQGLSEHFYCPQCTPVSFYKQYRQTNTARSTQQKSADLPRMSSEACSPWFP